MAIASLHRTLSRTLLTLGVVSLVACGGGGGGKKKDPAPDTTPNAYSYTATSNAELSAVITSAPVTITGINAATPVSITGGEYSINGGAFTAVAGTVTSGQTITIRLTAPAANSTSASARLTVGGVAATFTVTTKADTTPDAFAFTAQINAALNTEYTSNTITVAGIDTAVPVSITGGTYSINGGAFTAADGTVSVNNTVVVKGTSTSESESTHNVVLTIGGVSATYAITTVADTTPPVAEFKFPTPYTMSEASSVIVRGTATDDHAVTNVKVVVRSFKLDTPAVTLSTAEINATPKAEGDYSSWTVDVPLTALAENEIKVVATDDRENETQLAEANKVVIRQADVASAFPDEVNQFSWSYANLLVDNHEGRNRILITSGENVFSIDLLSGQRETLFTESCNLAGWDIDPITMHIFGICDGSPIKEFDLVSGQTIATYNVGSSLENYATPRAAVVDRENGRAQLVVIEAPGEVSGNNGRVTAFSLENKIISVLVNADQPSLMQRVGDVIIDGDRYLVPGGNTENNFGGQIIGINALTGAQTVVSDNSIGDGDAYGISNTKSFFSSIVKDETNNRLFISEEPSNKFFTLDLTTLQRQFFSDLSYEDGNSIMYLRASDLEIDEQSGRLYLFDNRRQTLLVIDAETGAKAILSKSKNDF